MSYVTYVVGIPKEGTWLQCIGFSAWQKFSKDCSLLKLSCKMTSKLTFEFFCRPRMSKKDWIFFGTHE